MARKRDESDAVSQKVDLWMAEMNDKGVESERAALHKYPRGKN
jgi:hypothetical protein